MENAVSDGTGGEEREDEDEEGVKESEEQVIDGNCWGFLQLKRGVEETEVGFDGGGGGLGKELIDEGEGGEGEGKREEEEDGESKEVAGVGVDYAFRFGKDGPEVDVDGRRCWPRCHGGRRGRG